MTLFQALPELRTSEKGSVFVFVAVAALMLIASTGAAIDMARAQVLQQKIQTALDAAGLAAGATANSIDVQTQAQKYFTANFPTGYLGSGKVTVVATMNATNSIVTLSASTTQATTFMKAVGINSVSVAANSQVTRANLGMELVLVLDNTGSMASAVNPSNSNTPKIQALKDSITDTGGLLDILYGNSDTVPNLWVGVVPFSDMVNIGSNHAAWMDTSYDNGLDYGPTIGSSCPKSGTVSGTRSTSPTRCTYSIKTSQTQPDFGLTNWGGCVTSRSATAASSNEPSLTLDSSDDYPASSSVNTLFRAFYYPTTSGTASSSDKCSGGSNAWNCTRTSGSGSNQYTYTTYNSGTSTTNGNLNCLDTEVLSMTSSKSSVVSRVDAMDAVGSTMINLGMSWGYRMLSPNWQGKWGGEMDNTGSTDFPVLPLDYHTALMNKVVILMTDGVNSTGSNSAYINQSSPSNTKLDNNTKAICDAMKSHGIIIYTIGFGTDDNNTGGSTSVDGPLLKYCATQNYTNDTSHYFLAPTNADLAGVFQQIGSSLANLRVSQ